MEDLLDTPSPPAAGAFGTDNVSGEDLSLPRSTRDAAQAALSDRQQLPKNSRISSGGYARHPEANSAHAESPSEANAHAGQTYPNDVSGLQGSIHEDARKEKLLIPSPFHDDEDSNRASSMPGDSLEEERTADAAVHSLRRSRSESADAGPTEDAAVSPSPAEGVEAAGAQRTISSASKATNASDTESESSIQVAPASGRAVNLNTRADRALLTHLSNSLFPLPVSPSSGAVGALLLFMKTGFLHRKTRHTRRFAKRFMILDRHILFSFKSIPLKCTNVCRYTSRLLFARYAVTPSPAHSLAAVTSEDDQFHPSSSSSQEADAATRAGRFASETSSSAARTAAGLSAGGLWQASAILQDPSSSSAASSPALRPSTLRQESASQTVPLCPPSPWPGLASDSVADEGPPHGVGRSPPFSPAQAPSPLSASGRRPGTNADEAHRLQSATGGVTATRARVARPPEAVASVLDSCDLRAGVLKTEAELRAGLWRPTEGQASLPRTSASRSAPAGGAATCCTSASPLAILTDAALADLFDFSQATCAWDLRGVRVSNFAYDKQQKGFTWTLHAPNVWHLALQTQHARKQPEEADRKTRQSRRAQAGDLARTPSASSSFVGSEEKTNATSTGQPADGGMQRASAGRRGEYSSRQGDVIGANQGWVTQAEPPAVSQGAADEEGGDEELEDDREAPSRTRRLARQIEKAAQKPTAVLRWRAAGQRSKPQKDAVDPDDDGPPDAPRSSSSLSSSRRSSSSSVAGAAAGEGDEKEGNRRFEDERFLMEAAVEESPDFFSDCSGLSAFSGAPDADSIVTAREHESDGDEAGEERDEDREGGGPSASTHPYVWLGAPRPSKSGCSGADDALVGVPTPQLAFRSLERRCNETANAGGGDGACSPSAGSASPARSPARRHPSLSAPARSPPARRTVKRALPARGYFDDLGAFAPLPPAGICMETLTFYAQDAVVAHDWVAALRMCSEFGSAAALYAHSRDVQLYNNACTDGLPHWLWPSVEWVERRETQRRRLAAMGAGISDADASRGASFPPSPPRAHANEATPLPRSAVEEPVACPQLTRGTECPLDEATSACAGDWQERAEYAGRPKSESRDGDAEGASRALGGSSPGRAREPASDARHLQGGRQAAAVCAAPGEGGGQGRRRDGDGGSQVEASYVAGLELDDGAARASGHARPRDGGGEVDRAGGGGCVNPFAFDPFCLLPPPSSASYSLLSLALHSLDVDMFPVGYTPYVLVSIQSSLYPCVLIPASPSAASCSPVLPLPAASAATPAAPASASLFHKLFSRAAPHPVPTFAPSSFVFRPSPCLNLPLFAVTRSQQDLVIHLYAAPPPSYVRGASAKAPTSRGKSKPHKRPPGRSAAQGGASDGRGGDRGSDGGDASVETEGGAAGAAAAPAALPCPPPSGERPPDTLGPFLSSPQPASSPPLSLSLAGPLAYYLGSVAVPNYLFGTSAPQRLSLPLRLPSSSSAHTPSHPLADLCRTRPSSAATASSSSAAIPAASSGSAASFLGVGSPGLGPQLAPPAAASALTAAQPAVPPAPAAARGSGEKGSEPRQARSRAGGRLEISVLSPLVWPNFLQPVEEVYDTPQPFLECASVAAGAAATADAAGGGGGTWLPIQQLLLQIKRLGRLRDRVGDFCASASCLMEFASPWLSLLCLFYLLAALLLLPSRFFGFLLLPPLLLVLRRHPDGDAALVQFLTEFPFFLLLTPQRHLAKLLLSPTSSAPPPAASASLPLADMLLLLLKHQHVVCAPAPSTPPACGRAPAHVGLSRAPEDAPGSASARASLASSVDPWAPLLPSAHDSLASRSAGGGQSDARTSSGGREAVDGEPLNSAQACGVTASASASFALATCGCFSPSCSPWYLPPPLPLLLLPGYARRGPWAPGCSGARLRDKLADLAFSLCHWARVLLAFSVAGGAPTLSPSLFLLLAEDFYWRPCACAAEGGNSEVTPAGRKETDAGDDARDAVERPSARPCDEKTLNASRAETGDSAAQRDEAEDDEGGRGEAEQSGVDAVQERDRGERAEPSEEGISDQRRAAGRGGLTKESKTDLGRGACQLEPCPELLAPASGSEASPDAARRDRGTQRGAAGERGELMDEGERQAAGDGAGRELEGRAGDEGGEAAGAAEQLELTNETDGKRRTHRGRISTVSPRCPADAAAQSGQRASLCMRSSGIALSAPPPIGDARSRARHPRLMSSLVPCAPRVPAGEDAPREDAREPGRGKSDSPRGECEGRRASISVADANGDEAAPGAEAPREGRGPHGRPTGHTAAEATLFERQTLEGQGPAAAPGAAETDEAEPSLRLEDEAGNGTLRRGANGEAVGEESLGDSTLSPRRRGPPRSRALSSASSKGVTPRDDEPAPTLLHDAELDRRTQARLRSPLPSSPRVSLSERDAAGGPGDAPAGASSASSGAEKVLRDVAHLARKWMKKHFHLHPRSPSLPGAYAHSALPPTAAADASRRSPRAGDEGRGERGLAEGRAPATATRRDAEASRERLRRCGAGRDARGSSPGGGARVEAGAHASGLNPRVASAPSGRPGRAPAGEGDMCAGGRDGEAVEEAPTPAAEATGERSIHRPSQEVGARGGKADDEARDEGVVVFPRVAADAPDEGQVGAPRVDLFQLGNALDYFLPPSASSGPSPQTPGLIPVCTQTPPPLSKAPSEIMAQDPPTWEASDPRAKGTSAASLLGKRARFCDEDAGARATAWHAGGFGGVQKRGEDADSESVDAGAREGSPRARRALRRAETGSSANNAARATEAGRESSPVRRKAASSKSRGLPRPHRKGRRMSGETRRRGDECLPADADLDCGPAVEAQGLAADGEKLDGMEDARLPWTQRSMSQSQAFGSLLISLILPRLTPVMPRSVDVVPPLVSPYASPLLVARLRAGGAARAALRSLISAFSPFHSAFVCSPPQGIPPARRTQQKAGVPSHAGASECAVSRMGTDSGEDKGDIRRPPSFQSREKGACVLHPSVCHVASGEAPVVVLSAPPFASPSSCAASLEALLHLLTVRHPSLGSASLFLLPSAFSVFSSSPARSGGPEASARRGASAASSSASVGPPCGDWGGSPPLHPSSLAALPTPSSLYLGSGFGSGGAVPAPFPASGPGGAGGAVSEDPTDWDTPAVAAGAGGSSLPGGEILAWYREVRASSTRFLVKLWRWVVWGEKVCNLFSWKNRSLTEVAVFLAALTLALLLLVPLQYLLAVWIIHAFVSGQKRGLWKRLSRECATRHVEAAVYEIVLSGFSQKGGAAAQTPPSQAASPPPGGYPRGEEEAGRVREETACASPAFQPIRADASRPVPLLPLLRFLSLSELQQLRVNLWRRCGVALPLETLWEALDEAELAEAVRRGRPETTVSSSRWVRTDWMTNLLLHAPTDVTHQTSAVAIRDSQAFFEGAEFLPSPEETAVWSGSSRAGGPRPCTASERKPGAPGVERPGQEEAGGGVALSAVSSVLGENAEKWTAEEGSREGDVARSLVSIVRESIFGSQGTLGVSGRADTDDEEASQQTARLNAAAVDVVGGAFIL
ncbi:hypothetical protein BESB_063120 [Besnoitia besnoiti]|uniref:Uncharacterized protein n=1 Tax=Besnoitia besnoiti TaxID=94643 RepID=A0A2A9MBS2_BESBE|nr:hypothetical protein BESB_063120 [Besnoitia besnoiti]PFH35425.1 hypothetical protein BESB_063120 [Besnoitia besnoiti]